MNRNSTLIALAVTAFLASTAIADDPATVKTHSLSVEQKLVLLETIEITSEKELEPVKEADPEVDAILDEIAQLESDVSDNE